MKITIAKNAGFCFGVKRAYDLACVNSKDCDSIFILGKLVHNDDVCGDLKKRGVKEIKKLNEVRNGTVIFTAHGIGPKMYANAQKRGLKVIDTTCPKVMKAQRLAENYAGKNFEVIIFGDKNHKEVRSILEWSKNKAKIIENSKEAKKLKLDKKKKYCLVSQTTQNAEEFKKISRYLGSRASQFMVFNTICQSTDDRQNEIRKMAKCNDVMIVIGGRDSANSRMLYEISREINPKSYFVENEKKLQKRWFQGKTKIAIGAGASTPERVIKKIVDKIRNFS